MRLNFAVAAGAALVASCATTRSGAEYLTISASELARDLARGPAWFRGRNVRVCRGRLYAIRPADRHEWSFDALEEPFPHGAMVNVKGCGSATPQLDAEGCLRGRIARPDGALADPPPDESVIVSAAIESSVWYLHAECPRPGGG